jgi:hypothetical protein
MGVGGAFGSSEEFDDPAFDVAPGVVGAEDRHAVEIFQGSDLAIDAEGKVFVRSGDFDEGEFFSDEFEDLVGELFSGWSTHGRNDLSLAATQFTGLEAPQSGTECEDDVGKCIEGGDSDATDYSAQGDALVVEDKHGVGDANGGEEGPVF